MQVFGQVISVDVDVQVNKKDGGTYPGSRLTYRDSSGKVAEQAFHQNVFRFNGALKATLTTLKAGDSICITKEKKGEFWNVVSIEKTATTTIQETQPVSSGSTPTTDMRQLYIIRQSSLGHAVSLLAANGGKKNTTLEVIEVADQFVEYVLNGLHSKAVEDEFNTDDVM